MLPVEGVDVGCESERRQAGQQRAEANLELQPGQSGAEAVMHPRNEGHMPVGLAVKQRLRTGMGQLQEFLTASWLRARWRPIPRSPPRP